METGNITPSILMNTVELNTGVNGEYISLTANLTTSFSSELYAPESRLGLSLEPGLVEDAGVPEGAGSLLARINISFNGLNNFLENIWYVVWGSLWNDSGSNGLDSEQCLAQDSLNDPCPYPPIVQSAGFFDGLLLAILFFPTLRTSYFYEFYVPAPTLDFVDDELTASAEATMVVKGGFLWFGSSKQITINAGLDIGASIPTYDSESGVLGDFQLSSVDLIDPQIDFHIIAISNILTFLLLPVIDRAVSFFANDILGIANTEIANVFTTIPPLKIPPVPNFPVAGRGIQFTLSGGTINGVSANGTIASLLRIESGLSLSVIDIPDESTSALADLEVLYDMSDPSICTKRAYENAYEWALESMNPNSMFSASCSHSSLEPDEITMLRWSSETNSVQMSTDYGFKWEIAPKPEY